LHQVGDTTIPYRTNGGVGGKGIFKKKKKKKTGTSMPLVGLGKEDCWKRRAAPAGETFKECGGEKKINCPSKGSK